MAETNHRRPPVAYVVAAYLGRDGAIATLTLATFAALPPPGALAIARIAAVLGLIAVPILRRDPRFWVPMAVLVVAGTLRHPWLDLDNHHVLQLYWFAALALTSFAEEPGAALRRTARLMIGLTFLFATIWKVIVPDFADGTFLTYLISVEPTIERTAVALGWQELGLVAGNRAELASALGDPAHGPVPASLEVSSAAARAAGGLAVVTIVVEGAVAVLYLSPMSRRLRWLRDLSLAAFVAVTYLILPVITFGALLAALGLASSSLPDRPAAVLYLAVALLIAV
ncbi:hypothetical protein [Nitriliruptor alkaliphilus]|uniref:hypothetical protein n=1 Tax=Nitriliruptor alkaliphilus TaxID=427918 RepID=UPI001B80885A|nr:hypothetical protein [Nitriliruptor alkaliphilus]